VEQNSAAPVPRGAKARSRSNWIRYGLVLVGALIIGVSVRIRGRHVLRVGVDRRARPLGGVLLQIDGDFSLSGLRFRLCCSAWVAPGWLLKRVRRALVPSAYSGRNKRTRSDVARPKNKMEERMAGGSKKPHEGADQGTLPPAKERSFAPDRKGESSGGAWPARTRNARLPPAGTAATRADKVRSRSLTLPGVGAPLPNLRRQIFCGVHTT